MRKLYGNPLDDLRRYSKHGRALIRKDDEVMVDDDAVRRLIAQGDEADRADENGEDEDDEDEQAEKAKHLVSTLADLIAEGSEGRTDRPTALRHLLHTASGNALVHRLRGAQKRLGRKEKTMKSLDRTDGLRSIIKSSGGLEGFCKSLAVDPTIAESLSEHEFTHLVTEEARKLYPKDRPDTAFAKYFSSPDSYVIRQAHQIISSTPQQQYSYLKSATLEPRVSGGRDAQDVDDPKDALKKLNELAAEQRRANPELSDAQAFSRVYSDPKNRALAEAERRQNRPRVA